jgi:hypothetical protein
MKEPLKISRKSCAVSALVEIAPQGQKDESDFLLGHLPYLASKGKGESSMVGKRLNLKVCKVKCRKSCTYGEACIG